ncbi:hypothetical protein DKY63_10520 [Pseudomonas putida]|uniref:Uncharacterized protein n=1 Tax=Pseudomonas putida TaxID=303 RepID=A0A2Z4RJW7_PSEPU|nr:hypothetical protein DKY63_10520 [Pseudomonas putida]
MVVNDNAGCLIPHGALGFIASRLAPTGVRGGLAVSCRSCPGGVPACPHQDFATWGSRERALAMDRLAQSFASILSIWASSASTSRALRLLSLGPNANQKINGSRRPPHQTPNISVTNDDGTNSTADTTQNQCGVLNNSL